MAKQFWFDNSDHAVIRLKRKGKRTVNVRIPEPKVFSWRNLLYTVNKSLIKYGVGVRRYPYNFGEIQWLSAKYHSELEFDKTLEKIFGYPGTSVHEFSNMFRAMTPDSKKTEKFFRMEIVNDKYVGYWN